MKPILPVCYYEYGESLLDEDDLIYALIYYRLSGMIAGALSFTNISKGVLSSRYEGIPDYDLPDRYSFIFRGHVPRLVKPRDHSRAFQIRDDIYLHYSKSSYYVLRSTPAQAPP